MAPRGVLVSMTCESTLYTLITDRAGRQEPGVQQKALLLELDECRAGRQVMQCVSQCGRLGEGECAEVLPQPRKAFVPASRGRKGLPAAPPTFCEGLRAGLLDGQDHRGVAPARSMASASRTVCLQVPGGDRKGNHEHTIRAATGTNRPVPPTSRSGRPRGIRERDGLNARAAANSVAATLWPDVGPPVLCHDVPRPSVQVVHEVRVTVTWEARTGPHRLRTARALGWRTSHAPARARTRARVEPGWGVSSGTSGGWTREAQQTANTTSPRRPGLKPGAGTRGSPSHPLNVANPEQHRESGSREEQEPVEDYEARRLQLDRCRRQARPAPRSRMTIAAAGPARGQPGQATEQTR